MTSPGTPARLRARISGLVQGVSFRWYTVQTAERLGLSGWVRNRPDGSVELVAEGRQAELEQLVAWCQHGPSSAVVERVEVEWSEPSGEFSGFDIRR